MVDWAKEIAIIDLSSQLNRMLYADAVINGVLPAIRHNYAVRKNSDKDGGENANNDTTGTN